jgi:Flp pilus assembly protein TadD
LQPEQSSALDTLGWVYYLRGENDIAITELEKAATKTPDSAEINYHLGLALKKANRLEEAREKLEKAMSQENFSEREAAEEALKELQSG